MPAAVADQLPPATRSCGPSLARASMAPGAQDGGFPVDVFVHDEQP